MQVAAQEFEFISLLFYTLGALPNKTGTASQIVQNISSNDQYPFSAYKVLQKMRKQHAIQYCSLSATYYHHPVQQKAISEYFSAFEA